MVKLRDNEKYIANNCDNCVSINKLNTIWSCPDSKPIVKLANYPFKFEDASKSLRRRLFDNDIKM